ncbi:hypothetical protein PFISCL1PPCAC_5677 [Pristionchus fissidentatus]|uniref:WD40 domain-containing protein n=1 Tax=Pristionchus fissidentatus TaxID=1538716 RepID=A0AAV5V765_9BILA|nr:hypothetical protein PFISCL1PPCAC_5677 [Pristionchus fissidentatus]
MVDSVQPSELLLAGCSSSDLFSTLLIDPKTGVSSWSHKGSELQGGSIGKVLPLGTDGEHLLLSMKDRPFLHAIGVNSHERFHQRTSVCGTVRDMTASSDGSLLFVAIDKRIFVWLLSNGEMLGVRDVHLREITCIALSVDDSALVTTSEDGGVRVFLVSDLISSQESSSNPFREWQAHSLSITGLSLSSSSSLRVATCSLDHTATLHSVALDTCLLRVGADRSFTSISLCPAESRLVLGTDKGMIACVSLHDAARLDQKEITLSTTNSTSTDFLLRGRHEGEVSRLAFNSDGTLLASGDNQGKYVIWQIGSKQVLKESSMHGAVCTLRFVPYWKAVMGREDKGLRRPHLDLKRNPDEKREIRLLRSEQIDTDDYWISVIDNLLNEGGESKKSTVVRRETEDGDEDKDEIIKRLTTEKNRLMKINKELYDYTTTEVFKIKK